ncbi:MAG: membrane protein insertion efficiency factor YidD [Pseudomonadota bacterium]
MRLGDVPERHANSRPVLSRIVALLLSAPIHFYRWTLKPFVGWQCRHLPTCSEYGLEAIATNGAWRGGWLTLSRLCRCRPGGTHGYDPVPDITDVHHRFTPWRYGRWRCCHCEQDVSSETPDHSDDPASQ